MDAPTGVPRRVCRPCRYIQDGRGARTEWNTTCPKCGEELVETVVFHRSPPAVQQAADDAEFIRKMEEAEATRSRLIANLIRTVGDE